MIMLLYLVGIKQRYYSYLDKIGTDSTFACPSFQMPEIYSKLNNDVYFYEYSNRISTTIFPEIMGVVHEDELPILFDEQMSNKIPPILSTSNYFHRPLTITQV